MRWRERIQADDVASVQQHSIAVWNRRSVSRKCCRARAGMRPAHILRTEDGYACIPCGTHASDLGACYELERRVASALSLHPRPTVLVGNDDDLSADSFVRFLEPYGIGVVRVRSGSDLMQRGPQIHPDAVMIDYDLPGSPAPELCRRLPSTTWFDESIPLIVTARRELRVQQRYGLLQAGAWEVIREPADPRELLLKLRTYIGAKRAADRALNEGLIDRETGLYNNAGIKRRCRELVADAFRRHAALACLAVSPEPEQPETDQAPVISHLATLLQTTRQSDVVGRLDENEFCVIAPRTDPNGAVGLAQRLVHATYRGVRDARGEARPIRIRIGYDAVPNMHDMPSEADRMLEAAVEALHRIPGSAPHPRVQPFRPFEHRRPAIRF